MMNFTQVGKLPRGWDLDTVLGLIPEFFYANDPRPAKEQINERYAHGGGWHPLAKFTMLDSRAIKYPGDNPMKVMAEARLGSETILVYAHGFVCILQDDGSFEVSRLD